jgi:hypothetical protein
MMKAPNCQGSLEKKWNFPGRPSDGDATGGTIKKSQIHNSADLASEEGDEKFVSIISIYPLASSIMTNKVGPLFTIFRLFFKKFYGLFQVALLRPRPKDRKSFFLS